MSVLYDFSGKVALITGSSQGIGAATALLFAKSGAQVVINGVIEEDVHSVANQCSDVSPNGSKALAVVADITIEEDVKRLVQSTIDTFGKLDILVNNAGIGLHFSITDSDFMQKYHKVLDLNINSVVFLTHNCVKYLEKTKGNIINISSLLSVRAYKRESAYCMSKASLDMFTRCMALELGPKNIRVNSINPGMIRTKWKEQDGNEVGMYEKAPLVIPVGRVGEVEDIANAILFLAADQAGYINGSHLFIDGGEGAGSIQAHVE